MPLVAGSGPEEAAVDRSAWRARKIHPEYSRGRLVRVAVAANQPEAELIANLLLEEGIPSLLRRGIGVDVPDFLAAGARDVLVPESALEAAREVLLQDQPASGPPRPPAPPMGRLWIPLGLLGVGGLGALLVLLRLPG